MSYEFRPDKRENVPLLLALAGGTGSGKTLSALRVARGIANGQPFAGIDTENGRMLIYADDFPELMHTSIDAPFRPTRYTEAIDAADEFLAKQGVPVENRVIVVDSASHEWYGDGGCLDWHDELMGGNQAKNLSAWIEPKKAHKRMVTRLLRVEAHVILCFRAEPKVEAVKTNGKIEIVPKASLTGLDGWIPIAEKNLPFEATASFLCMADRPGIPKPIKLPEKLRPLVALDAPLDEQAGRRLAEWAAGGSGSSARALSTPATAAAPSPASGGARDDIEFGGSAPVATSGDEIDDLTAQLLAFATDANRGTIAGAIAKNKASHWSSPGEHASWLRSQIERANAKAGTAA